MELNSATEISTDSEFERDPVTPQYSEDSKKTTRIQVSTNAIKISGVAKGPELPLRRCPKSGSVGAPGALRLGGDSGALVTPAKLQSFFY